MKIKPAIRGPKNYCDFADLDVGDAFAWHGFLWMKTEDLDDYKQMYVCLSDGNIGDNMCGEQVLPVDAVLTWTKQEEDK